MPDLERRSILDFDPEARLELRASDTGPGTVVGPVLHYGDVATLPFGQERILPGAFGDLSTADLFVNRMHMREQTLANTGAGLTIDDNAERLHAETELIDDMYGEMTAKQVKNGRLRGHSIEFRTLEDDFLDGIRIIKRARLYGFGIVDKPAYPQSVANMRSWAEYRSEYGLEVRQQTATERSVIISGPAGAGKTERAREIIAELRAEGLEPIAADFQSLYAALLLVNRGDDGRFPERADDAAYILGMVEYIRSTIARRALADDMPVVATISERSDGTRYKALAALLGGAAREETIDPGVDEIVGRFMENNQIPSQCREAIGRWYGDDEISDALSQRMRRAAVRQPETRRRVV